MPRSLTAVHTPTLRSIGRLEDFLMSGTKLRALLMHGNDAEQLLAKVLAASPSATPLWPLAENHFFCAVVALVALITYRGSKAYRGAV